jgi:hypothetical protein
MITDTRNVLICLRRAGSFRYLEDELKKYKIKIAALQEEISGWTMLKLIHRNWMFKLENKTARVETPRN